jgi:small-conductance mechanosensitive channel/CRP-like cAMP-binding protein
VPPVCPRLDRVLRQPPIRECDQKTFLLQCSGAIATLLDQTTLDLSRAKRQTPPAMNSGVSSLLELMGAHVWALGFLVLIGVIAARYWASRNSLICVSLQVFVLLTLTGLMLAADIVPYRPATNTTTELQMISVGALKAVWWMAAAWLSTGFLRAFVVLGRRPNEAKLVQDLLAALVYLAALFAIVANVFDLPVKGLLATSGALAIILGLALQSSLGDVFSGIVLNLERPYHVGDWIILDDTLQGTVIETNWRSTHILTGNQDVAVIPNSVVAKAKIVNCNAPDKTHGTTMRVRLGGAINPAAGCDLLQEVLLGSSHVLRSPAPTVSIKDMSAEMIDFELYYVVRDVAAVDDSRTELFDRVYRAATAAGMAFASRNAISASVAPSVELSVADRLLANVSLFSTLTGEERGFLAAQMQRRTYGANEVVVSPGTVVQSLSIIAYGVLVATEEDNGSIVERLRLTPGTYFGEVGLLTGKPIKGQIAALTKVVLYQISKTALLPLLQARPGMADELSELLASRQLARQTVLDEIHANHHSEQGLTKRVLADIKRFFSLH